MIRTLCLITGILLTPALAHAQSAKAAFHPEPQNAYRWRIAFRVSSHPVFSDRFREQLSRELLALARNHMGDVGTAEVIDLTLAEDNLDLLCQQFLRRGWPAIEANPDLKGVIDPAREITGIKTHFFNIEYRDGIFYLESRQHDGFTGLISPLLRKASTRLQEMIPRLAGLLIEPDFGPVGTVETIPDEVDRVRLVLRGHQVGPVSKWVKVGDVFAISVIKDVPKPVDAKAGPATLVRVGKEQPLTLLRVIESVKDGACTCSVLTHFREDFAFGVEMRYKRALGVRCMKLPTVDATVQLRLLNKGGVPHARSSQLRVAASDTDFRLQPGPEGQFELRDGLFRSTRTFPGIACVRVSVGEDPPRLFPVAVLGSDPQPLLFELKPEDEKRADFASRCNDLRGRIADVSTGQLALFGSVYKLIDARQIRAALGEAEKGFARVNEAEQALMEELRKTRAEPAASDEIAKNILEGCEKQLLAIRTGQDTFAKRIEELKKAAESASTPAQLDKEFRAKELLERIKEFIARGDVPEALDLYTQLIALVPEQQELKDARAKLMGEWATKDEEHRKAREAIRIWQQARSTQEFLASVGPLTPAVDVMLRKRDRLGLRKLLNTFEPAIVTLNGLISSSDGQTEDGAKDIKDLQKVVDEIRKIADKAEQALKRLIAEAK